MHYYCEVAKRVKDLAMSYLEEGEKNFVLLDCLLENNFSEGDLVSQVLIKLEKVYCTEDEGRLKLLNKSLVRLVSKL